jgi:competence protein ComEA
MAEAILAYRKDNGNFKSVDELTKVKGIGDKTLEKLKPFLLAI